MIKIKYNLGCGNKLLDGYVNLDKDDCDLDVFPIVLKDCESILLDNVLEHVFNDRKTLIELRKTLNVNGFIEIYVPFWSSRVEHKRFFHPKGYFNDLCGLGSKNSIDNIKLFSKSEEYYCRKSIMIYFPFIKKNLYVKLEKR